MLLVAASSVKISTDLFVACVAALGSVGWGASPTSPIANRRAASCRNRSSNVITIFYRDGEAALFVAAAVKISTDRVVACVSTLGKVGWGASATSPIANLRAAS